MREAARVEKVARLLAPEIGEVHCETHGGDEGSCRVAEMKGGACSSCAKRVCSARVKPGWPQSSGWKPRPF